jgi:O-antigen/teichoic acid export membrane protein
MAGAEDPVRGRSAAVGGWLLKGGASIADEAMLTGANFVLSILLGRWLQPAQYGAFALAYSLFQLIGTFHTSVLAEPLLVFGPGKYAGRFRKYLGLLSAGHLAIMVPVGLLLLGSALVLGRLYSPEVRRALAALALAGPFILLLWLLRRACYVVLKPEWAVLGSAVYSLCLLAAAFGLRAAASLSPASGFLAMGASAFLVSLLLAARLRPQWRSPGGPSAAIVASEHWRYARWAVASAALTWVPGNLYFSMLPAWLGLEGTAALRALINLVMPISHAITALTILLVPLLARRLQQGRAAMRRPMRLFLVLFLSAAGLYCLGLILFRRELLLLLYGSKYSSSLSLVPFIGLLPLFSAFIAVYGSALRVMERPDKVFWSYLASSAVAVACGIPLARLFGVAGALAGVLSSYLTTAVIMFVLDRELLTSRDALGGR